MKPKNVKPEYKILVVEDDIAILESLLELLELSNFCALGARDGVEGLKAAEEFNPDLIISDVLMPKMDGFGLIQKIRSNPLTEMIPFIFLTAKADTDSMIEGLALQATDYITKPYDSQVLMLKIKNLLHRESRLANNKPNTSSESISRDTKFLTNLDAILENQLFNSALTVGDLASQLNMSPATFNRTLKKASGKSPAKYIKDFRLNRAKEMIQSNAGNVSEIAFKTGFGSLSYFSTQYKNSFNVNPSDDFPS